LPMPEMAIGQTDGIVIGMNDTLPPSPDQSRLVHEWAGKAVVVGEQRDFEAILRRVADAFMARHKS
jgi:hypothetical protein